MIIEENILNSIVSPEILKTLDRKQIDALANEIRSFLIKHVSENGGHLASNLGTVELTLALLRSFDFLNDRIVWDVGHQSYTYKILTGRFKEFNTIRKRNGLSGFPKREESEYDHFNTGHSSTSISAALGFARAARLSGRNDYSIAVIGDGALTGGMALEAMNDAGAAGDKVIIILNDNEMSISRNVGGIAEYFSRLRSLRLYSGTNEKVRRVVEKIPLIGIWLSKRVHNLKSAVKYLFSQGMLFEEMGLSYLGPVNGHDVRKLESILNDAKNVKGPVLLHVITTKGRGLPEAESEPEKYHGVKGNGHDKSSQNELMTFSETLGLSLTDLAKETTNMVVISPAVAPGCGLVDYSRKYPDRFFDVGIAEQHAVTLAAGMACSGFIPVVSSYSTFMQRAYDQILHDVCLMNLHVVFTMDRAGVVGNDGETHQGIYDLSYLSHMPGIKVKAPSDSGRLSDILKHSVLSEKGPIVIRYPKGSGSAAFTEISKLQNGYRIHGIGTDILVLSYGMLLDKLLEYLKETKDFVGYTIADIETLVPLDSEGIENLSAGYRKILFVEDVVFNGSCVQRFLSKCSKECYEKVDYIVVPDKINASGSVEDILDGISMGRDGIIEKIKHMTGLSKL